MWIFDLSSKSNFPSAHKIPQNVFDSIIAVCDYRARFSLFYLIWVELCSEKCGGGWMHGYICSVPWGSVLLRMSCARAKRGLLCSFFLMSKCSVSVGPFHFDQPSSVFLFLIAVLYSPCSEEALHTWQWQFWSCHSPDKTCPYRKAITILMTVIVIHSFPTKHTGNGSQRSLLDSLL